MLGQHNWLVIMVTRNSLQIVGLGEDKVQTLPIPPNIMNNMEIIYKDGLYTLITDWLKQRVYANTGIIWLLSPDICFEHTLSTGESSKVDSEMLQFLDSVPFEDILSRVYKPLEWRQIVAVNKDLVMTLIQAFSLHGYSTKVVVPSRQVQAESTLTPEIAHLAIKHAAELERESLVSAPNPIEYKPISSPGQAPESPKPKSSLPLLLGVFGVLLAILGIVLYLNH